MNSMTPSPYNQTTKSFPCSRTSWLAPSVFSDIRTPRKFTGAHIWNRLGKLVEKWMQILNPLNTRQYTCLFCINTSTRRCCTSYYLCLCCIPVLLYSLFHQCTTQFTFFFLGSCHVPLWGSNTLSSCSFSIFFLCAIAFLYLMWTHQFCHVLPLRKFMSSFFPWKIATLFLPNFDFLFLHISILLFNICMLALWNLNLSKDFSVFLMNFLIPDTITISFFEAHYFLYDFISFWVVTF